MSENNSQQNNTNGNSNKKQKNQKNQKNSNNQRTHTPVSGMTIEELRTKPI
jgi:hypothetical protein